MPGKATSLPIPQKSEGLHVLTTSASPHLGSRCVAGAQLETFWLEDTELLVSSGALRC